MRFILLLALSGLVSCCSTAQNTPLIAAQQGAESTRFANKLANEFYNPSEAIKKQVLEIYDQLTAEQKAAQLIMVPSSEQLGFPYQSYVKPLSDKGITANYLFLKGTSASFKEQERYLSTHNTQAGLRPLNACDCEPTLMHYKFTDKPKMNPTSLLNDSLKITASLDSILQVMNSLNININFAPVIDLGANKAVINKRAFSNNRDSLIKYAGIFINHAQNKGIAATVKHFPGHGAVVGDTHKGTVWINGAMTELDNFKTVINTYDPLLVMIGHISIKNNAKGYNTPNGKPASISRNIATDLLKKEMKFRGIVTTDAMNMGAIKNIPNADFEAIKAGVDLIVMPNSPEKLQSQIVSALQANDDLSKQISYSVKKIILLKLLTGQYSQPPTD